MEKSVHHEHEPQSEPWHHLHLEQFFAEKGAQLRQSQQKHISSPLRTILRGEGRTAQAKPTKKIADPQLFGYLFAGCGGLDSLQQASPPADSLEASTAEQKRIKIDQPYLLVLVSIRLRTGSIRAGPAADADSKLKRPNHNKCYGKLRLAVIRQKTLMKATKNSESCTTTWIAIELTDQTVLGVRVCKTKQLGQFFNPCVESYLVVSVNEASRFDFHVRLPPLTVVTRHF